MKKEKIR